MSQALDSLLDAKRLAQCQAGDAELTATLNHSIAQALRPLFIRPAAAAEVAATPEGRRAAYVSALRRFDWLYDHAEGPAWRKGKAELARLRSERAAIDPTGELWKRHAPEGWRNDPEMTA